MQIIYMIYKIRSYELLVVFYNKVDLYLQKAKMF